MADIVELSENLTNQIAAGEVIERPASVVKELVENAIDAQATQIDILVEDAGVKSIRVIDNGQGIPANQVKRAFLRHATSKITSRLDLFKVMTLGFRGEALPSIASVADVRLITATAGSSSGYEVHLRGGEIIEEQGASARQGTDIIVTDLFYNTPARLKYLKSQATELSQIVDIVNRLAFSYPQISFRLSHQAKEILRTTGNGNLQQVVSSVYGVTVARDMTDITIQDNDFKVTGLISLPELTRANRSYMTLLINGRYVKNYSLTKALVKGYGTRLMVGRFPMAVIQIEMDPNLVDVNVHPQKFDVRLSKEEQLMNLIEKAVRDKFEQTNLIPDAYENYLGSENMPAFVQQLNDVSSPYKGSNLTASDDVATSFHSEALQPVVVENSAALTTEAVQSFKQKYSTESAPNPFGDGQQTMLPGQQTRLELKSETSDGKPVSTFPALDYIGQMHGTFLFAQAEDGLYLIDQHAAQERIKYEYYRQTLTQQGLELQKLLVPIVLSYSTVDMLQIESHHEELMALGLDLEPFGSNSLIVHEHPGWFVKGQEEATIKEMVDWLLRDGELSLADFRERTAIMMACKRSIKANWKINDVEARDLIQQLRQTQNPYNCPHGRPVIVSFSNTDMEKMFKRIQDSHESWIEYDNHPF
ncbi:DNA mismatch repair endonuclease MutL [Weissella diestrammenae]|uniref:DNA mismatch repair protein MutL n=1 Tax=Weissella diestrammenae TaxID=1162633 RepID=A0A7G9T465_9LACO|nr:DNA mismatch repair endonuclease MutL [Weissella diestrammenae]MCM0583414.1 DNA mismatch repair endonuclease MutL [Weissella diestrammenae]QNN74890.1 DNA mismatch repair endonuclease MutL [Weissella diestrammenae]